MNVCGGLKHSEVCDVYMPVKLTTQGDMFPVLYIGYTQVSTQEERMQHCVYTIAVMSANQTLKEELCEDTFFGVAIVLPLTIKVLATAFTTHLSKN